MMIEPRIFVLLLSISKSYFNDNITFSMFLRFIFNFIKTHVFTMKHAKIQIHAIINIISHGCLLPIIYQTSIFRHGNILKWNFCNEAATDYR